MTIELTSTLWVIGHSLCIYRALRALLKCPLSFSILVDISHDYHLAYSLNTFYSKGSLRLSARRKPRMNLLSKFHRSEKLRDHLRAQKVLNAIHWSCVLPGCSEILGGRVSLIDHLGQHEYKTRKFNGKLLMDYGFVSQKRYDYL